MEENKKKKKKIVFAHDRKEAVIAFLVFGLFIFNTIYMIVKYVDEQNSQPSAQYTLEEIQKQTPNEGNLPNSEEK